MSELDQIIKFHFQESIFDIILIASFKAAILFIVISELEEYTVRIALNSKSTNTTNNGTVLNSNHSTDGEVLIADVDDIVAINNENINSENSNITTSTTLLKVKNYHICKKNPSFRSRFSQLVGKHLLGSQILIRASVHAQKSIKQHTTAD